MFNSKEKQNINISYTIFIRKYTIAIQEEKTKNEKTNRKAENRTNNTML